MDPAHGGLAPRALEVVTSASTSVVITLLLLFFMWYSWLMTKLPEPNGGSGNEPKAPLHTRRWFMPTVMIIALAVMLVLLGLLFPEPFWRF